MGIGETEMHKFDSIVVKIEIATLLNDNGKLDMDRMERMSMILANLHNSGKHLILVTSGAIVLGSQKLKLKGIPKSLIMQQAAAAVGQAELIKMYQAKFEIFNQRLAQILLTNDIIANEERKENTLNTFNTLFEMSIIPVVNENDAVSTEDIEYMDNYPLAYNVANLSGSNMMIIRGGIEGEYFILMRGDKKAQMVVDEEFLVEKVESKLNNFDKSSMDYLSFPKRMEEILYI